MTLIVEEVTAKKNGTPIVTGVNLTIEPHQIVGIVGESGAGKTTLLRAILGLEVQSSGTVRVGRHSVTLPTSLMGSKIVAVRSQISAFFGPDSLRPYEKISDRVTRLRTPGQADETDEVRKLEALATRLGLTELLDRYPRELSMGQRARAGVFCALLSGRPFALLDEFGSNLDERTQVDLFAAARDFAAEKHGLGIVTHARRQLDTIAARVYELRDGRLREV